MARRKKLKQEVTLINFWDREKYAPFIRDVCPELQKLVLEMTILDISPHQQNGPEVMKPRTYGPDDKTSFTFPCPGMHIPGGAGIFEINDEIRYALNQRKKELEGQRQCNGVFLPGYGNTQCNFVLHYKGTATYKDKLNK